MPFDKTGDVIPPVGEMGGAQTDSAYKKRSFSSDGGAADGTPTTSVYQKAGMSSAGNTGGREPATTSVYEHIAGKMGDSDGIKQNDSTYRENWNVKADPIHQMTTSRQEGPSYSNDETAKINEGDFDASSLDSTFD